MSEPWDSMVRDAGYDPNTPEGRALAQRIEDDECRKQADGAHRMIEEEAEILQGGEG